MKTKTQTFSALVIALSLDTTIEAFQKEFTHSGVIQKSVNYDDEANSTTFRYTDEKGVTKWYSIEGELPSIEAPASIRAAVVILNGEDQIEPFDKDFLVSGIIKKGLVVDEATASTTFKYCDEKGVIKTYTIAMELDLDETAADAGKSAKAKPAAANKSAKAKTAAAKKSAKAKTPGVRTASAKKSLAKK